MPGRAITMRADNPNRRGEKPRDSAVTPRAQLVRMDVISAPQRSTAPHFTTRGDFSADLKRAVSRYFAGAGRSPRADGRMWMKTAILASWAIGSYLLLLLADAT